MRQRELDLILIRFDNPNQIEIVATLKGDIDGLTAVTQGLTEGAKAQLEKIMQIAEAAE